MSKQWTGVLTAVEVRQGCQVARERESKAAMQLICACTRPGVKINLSSVVRRHCGQEGSHTLLYPHRTSRRLLASLHRSGVGTRDCSKRLKEVVCRSLAIAERRKGRKKR
ncbi:hypothetical protein K438DRAFT_1152323 [Mycena galopus ATCC 62051]|nr:hypothetical protein K438DRAFT_1152323 [Mycena galopus ATCC 62051]